MKNHMRNRERHPDAQRRSRRGMLSMELVLTLPILFVVLLGAV